MEVGWSFGDVEEVHAGITIVGVTAASWLEYVAGV